MPTRPVRLGVALEEEPEGAGSRGRCSSTDPCGRRAARAARRRVPRGRGSASSTASLCGELGELGRIDGDRVRGDERPPSVVLDDRRRPVDRRAEDPLGRGEEVVAASGGCGSRPRRWRADPSWIARRIASGRTCPVVGLGPRDVDEVREDRLRPGTPDDAAARGRGGSRGTRPPSPGSSSSSSSTASAKPSFTVA